MKAMPRFAMTALFCGLSMVAASSVFAAPPVAMPKLEVIKVPMMLFGRIKLPLNYCDPLAKTDPNGKNCGKPVADKYCAMKYQNSTAQSFKRTPNPLPKTKTISSNQVCPSGIYNKCYGFLEITCAVTP